jgi:hypothetical protein
MGVTFGISIFSGSLCAFIASRMPFPTHIFDDYEHFKNVEYGDNLDQYNAADIVDNEPQSMEPAEYDDEKDVKSAQFRKESEQASREVDS